MVRSTIHHPTRRTIPIVSISGFQASDIGQYGIEGFDWGQAIGGIFDWITGLPLGVQTAPGNVFGADIPRIQLPPVVISEIPESYLPPSGGPINTIGPGGALSVPKGWETVIIGGVERVRVPDIYNRGTDPVLEPFDPNVVIGQVYDEQPTESQEDDAMAHDWGHLLRQGVETVATSWWSPDAAATPGIVPGAGGPGSSFVTGIALGGGGAVTPSATAANCEPCGPRYLTYDCKTGKFTKKRRRGRRRLATDRDLSDLAAIVAITGKGSAMNQAVAGMVRR